MKRDLTEYNKTYYRKNQAERKAQILVRQRFIRDFVQEEKIMRGCCRCGYNRSARALQYHHTDDNKEHNVARMVTQGRSLEAIREEIEKCILVCANCHAEIHENTPTAL